MIISCHLVYLIGIKKIKKFQIQILSIIMLDDILALIVVNKKCNTINSPFAKASIVNASSFEVSFDIINFEFNIILI